jgi:GGDEF domain-containing protein
MLCVDVDFFSGTPDHLANQTNHQAGELREVLRLTIARRVGRPLRRAILLGRTGRNQFAVFTTSASDRELAVVSESIKRAVQVPVVLKNMEIFLKAAIGIATLRARQPGPNLPAKRRTCWTKLKWPRVLRDRQAATASRCSGPDRYLGPY